MFFPVNNVPLWLEIVAKADPATYGVDVSRRLMIDLQPGAGGAPLGVTVLGHAMSLADEVLVVATSTLVLLAAASWSFGRQE